MKIKLFISTLAVLTITNLAHANSIPKPDKCPSIQSVATVGFDKVNKNRNTWIVSKNHNHFDTKEDWSFGALFIEADNESEAMAKATQALKTMFLVYGPSEGEDGWTCSYLSLANVGGVAHTPGINIKNNS